MARVLVRPRAEADVDEHFMHIAGDSLGAAVRFLDVVHDACQFLAEHPVRDP